MLQHDYYEVARHAETASMPPFARGCFDPRHEVLDIGAGSGEYTVMLARAGYRVLAIEPDGNARARLIARVQADPEIRGRVSVLPCRFQDAVLPERIGGAFARCVLAAFTAAERAHFWAEMEARLVEGAGVLFNHHFPAEIGPHPRRRVPMPRHRERLGRFTYRHFQTRTLEGDGLTVINEFELLDGERVLSSDRTVHVLEPYTEAIAVAELPEDFASATWGCWTSGISCEGPPPGRDRALPEVA